MQRLFDGQIALNPVGKNTEMGVGIEMGGLRAMITFLLGHVKGLGQYQL